MRLLDLYRGRRWGRLPYFTFCANYRQYLSNRYFLSRLEQNLIDNPGIEDFDFHHPLGGLHHGDDIAALYSVAGFDFPFDQGAGIHVGAQAGHAKLAHHCTILFTVLTITSGCGTAASSMCFE